MQKLVLFFLILFSTSYISLVNFAPQISAQEDSIQYEAVNPKDGLKYGIKRLQEKITLTLLSFSANKKADYYNQISNSRLAELKYIVDNKDEDNFEVATKRYFTTIGQYTEFLNTKKLDEKKVEAIKTFDKHKPILEKMRDSYEQTRAQWRFIHDDINYVNEYSKLLKS